MHVNRYRFEIGDLVTYNPSERDRHGRLVTLSKPRRREAMHGIITNKKKESYYIEARPIKCVEAHMYLVIFGEGAGQWVEGSDLIRAQKTDMPQQDERRAKP
jgi:hypothetical protein